MKDKHKYSILYLHGRPAPHKLHGRFAESVGSTFQYVDKIMRWQDMNKSFVFRLISWFVNALNYPRDYQYYLVDNLHLSPVLMKKLGLISKKQKIIVHMGSHTLFFMYSNWFSPWVNRLHKYMLKNYDVILCEGYMAEEFVLEILGDKSPETIYTFLGPPAERMEKLKAIDPNLTTKNILHISSGPDGFRTYYKGIMEMVKAFSKAHSIDNELTFSILGEWSEEVKTEAYSLLGDHQKEALRFEGVVDNIEEYLKNASLYMHCSNGDAFPTATVEAMTAGVVPLVSNWTGTKEIVNKIDENLISSMDFKDISDRILWYFNLKEVNKKQLSTKARSSCEFFTQENAIDHYISVFKKLNEQYSKD